MVFWRQWLLILLALALGGEISVAASAREDRAYDAAVGAFQDAMWGRAEAELAQFVQKYRNSSHVAEAVLLQAQAEFKQGKCREAIALLTNTNNLARAGTLADQYVYWTGEAHFQNTNFTQAAETFLSLARDFPESSLRLRAVVEAASAYAQLPQWPRVDAVLQGANGVFQRAAQMDPAGEMVSRGRLLLAQSKFEQHDFAAAAAVLESLDLQTLKLELDWQRAYLLCQVKLATGDLDAALAATTNLLQIARLEKDNDWLAESAASHADVLERLGQKAEAMAAYGDNLAPDTPVGRQRQAILKIAELAAAQNNFTNAGAELEKFGAQFPDSPAADLALLTLGELHLKDYLALRPAGAATNRLPQALALFDQFLGAFTNSPLLGRAHLDRGWGLWLAGKLPESLDSFKTAAQKLPPSEDLAVARFKMGDVLMAQTNYAGALTNYHAVLSDFTRFPAVAQTLADRALYQSLRACLELKNLAGAGNAMSQILKLHPAGDTADSGLLLVGEGYADLRQPANARALFQKFEGLFPDSSLRPQVELAVARTYEQEQNWPAAIGHYHNWLGDFPTNALQPRAEYALAWANFQAGDETNALGLFTNFVAQFATNELAPQAQWWVAEHFFRAGDFVDAEKNYQLLFQNWTASDLVYQARMMAGRAAMGRLGYSDAIRHFTSLTSDTNCPPELNVQALFAYGSALMRQDSPDTNNPLANFKQAVLVFNRICQLYPTNEPGALAWGEIGDCYLQLTNYDAATNAYARVFNTNAPANISARSQAQIGMGIALEKKAALAAGNEQNQLLQLALGDYGDVLYKKNLRDGETADPFWVKKAGLQAVDLAVMLGDGPAAEKICGRLRELFPQLADSLDKKIAGAKKHVPPGNN